LYANALAANKQYDEAIKTLQQIQRILKASNNGLASYDLQIAEYYNELGKKDSVDKYKPATIPVTRGRRRGGDNTAANPDGLRYVRLLAATGKGAEADTLLKSLPSTGDNAYLSEYNYTQGKIQETTKPELAAASYEAALKYDPYYFKVCPWLIDYYNKTKQPAKSQVLKSSLQSLKIQPGKNLSIN
jgi:tetratricopeptide (TPR) repeat protein